MLSSIYIDPSAQSQGLGTAAVKFTLNKARAKNIPVFLTSMPAVVGFYQNMGFKEIQDSAAETDFRVWTRGGVEGKEGWGVFRFVGMIWSPRDGDLDAKEQK